MPRESTTVRASADTGGKRPQGGDPGAVSLVRLRWGAICCQLLLFGVVGWGLGVRFPAGPLAAVIAFEVVENIVAMVLLRRGVRQGQWVLSGFLVLDLVAFTVLVSLSGAAYNPFSFLYLVYIVVALIVLGPWHAAGMVALSLLGYGLLFVEHVPQPAMTARQGQAMQLHLVGMWFAFLLAAVAILTQVGRLLSELQRRTAELQAVRERGLHNQRLSSLTTLAAGAAHELSTPLSSIAVTARELERGLQDRPGDDELLADARTIRAEVTRCKAILDQLTVDAGHVAGDEQPPRTVGELVEGALDGWRWANEVRTEIDDDAVGRVTLLPLRPVRHALLALLDNAVRADGRGGPVRMRVLGRGPSVVFEIADDGAGMDPETLRRAMDPFFSTREQGKGMGLGLYLARSVAIGLGGALALESSPGGGTKARLTLPLAPSAAGECREG